MKRSGKYQRSEQRDCDMGPCGIPEFQDCDIAMATDVNETVKKFD